MQILQILLVEQQPNPGSQRHAQDQLQAAGVYLARNLGAGARLAKYVMPTRDDGDTALGGVADQAHLPARAAAERAGEVRRLGTNAFCTAIAPHESKELRR